MAQTPSGCPEILDYECADLADNAQVAAGMVISVLSALISTGIKYKAASICILQI